MKPLALIVAAGTGGHLYPGVATARAIIECGHSQWDVVFAVRQGDMGKALLEREGFRVLEFSGQGFPRRPSIKILTFPLKVVLGFRQAYAALKELRPRVVIGMGGYLSFSVLIAARFLGIPTLIHEQNVLPGLANKWLARYASSIAVSFEESQKYFPNASASKKIWVSGLPVRQTIGKVSAEEGRSRLGLDSRWKTFLIFGGSLGAHHLNVTVARAWSLLSDLATDFQVIHVTGHHDFQEIRAMYGTSLPKALIMPYCHDMPDAMGAADLVICRAGASTIAELIVSQRPAILIPYPLASENHQLYNAEVLVKRALAEVIFDQDLSAEVLAKRLRPYIEDPGRLDQIKQRYQKEPPVLFQDAALHLGEFILKMNAGL